MNGCGKVFLRQHLGQFLEAAKASESQWTFLLLCQLIFLKCFVYIFNSLNVKVVWTYIYTHILWTMLVVISHIALSSLLKYFIPRKCDYFTGIYKILDYIFYYIHNIFDFILYCFILKTPFTPLASFLHYNLYFAWVTTWTSFNNGQRRSALQTKHKYPIYFKNFCLQERHEQLWIIDDLRTNSFTLMYHVIFCSFLELFRDIVCI